VPINKAMKDLVKSGIKFPPRKLLNESRMRFITIPPCP